MYVKFLDAHGQRKYGRRYATADQTIEDAIRPCHYPVGSVTQIEEITPEFDTFDPALHDFTGGDEYTRFVRHVRNTLLRYSQSLPPGLRVGKVLCLGVADGHAYYSVLKVGRTHCEIEWRGLGPARYTDDVLGWGGKFPNTLIARLIAQAEAFAAVFGDGHGAEAATDC